MRTSVSGIAIALLLAAGFVGCQSAAPGRAGSKSIPPLSPNAVSGAGLSTQEIADANALGTAKCMKCHGFYNPADYSQSEWDTWMRKMSRKAKLKPAQDELLRRYLAAFRTQGGTETK
jgi:hypothetical protein